MSNPVYPGDLNAAREFMSTVTRGGGSRPSRGDRQGGRGGGGGGGSGSSSYGGAQGGYGPRGGTSTATEPLTTEAPAHIWAPTNKLTNAVNQAAAAAANNSGSNYGSSMDIDPAAPVFTPAARGAPVQRQSAHVNAFSASTPSYPNNLFGNNNTARSRAIPIVAPQHSNSSGPAHGGARGLGSSIHASPSSNLQAKSANGTQVTYGAKGNPGLPTLAPIDQQTNENARGGQATLRDGTNAFQGRASSPARGLGASRHAVADVAAGSTDRVDRVDRTPPHKGKEHLDENGLLKSTVWGTDRGAVRDDDWLLTYFCERLTIHATAIARTAYNAGDQEAGTSLDAVVNACASLSYAKNELHDPVRTAEAQEALSEVQNHCWKHWVKYWGPQPANANTDATARASAVADAQSPTQSPNVQMRDAPAFAPQPRAPAFTPQPRQVQQPERAETAPAAACGTTDTMPASRIHDRPMVGGANVHSFGNINTRQQTSNTGFGSAPGRDFGDSNAQPFPGSGTQQKPGHSQGPVQQQPSTPANSGGFGGRVSVFGSPALRPQKGSQAQDTQSSAHILNMPAIYPDRRLPEAFDDPAAKAMFEDFFCKKNENL